MTKAIVHYKAAENDHLAVVKLPVSKGANVAYKANILRCGLQKWQSMMK
jgi:hypothetical protein